eukprot:Lithocolla_globosa_v1_NODE_625_length_3568_cov_66.349274.p3 type:complete len:141 gc:universal NODE_625_length_3568_cov_66.349274:2755-2333(-)
MVGIKNRGTIALSTCVVNLKRVFLARATGGPSSVGDIELFLSRDCLRGKCTKAELVGGTATIVVVIGDARRRGDRTTRIEHKALVVDLIFLVKRSQIVRNILLRTRINAFKSFKTSKTSSPTGVNDVITYFSHGRVANSD